MKAGVKNSYENQFEDRSRDHHFQHRHRRERHQPSAAALYAHCRNLLAAYKLPCKVRFEDIPETSTSEIQKICGARTRERLNP